jgi:hypothetical protein
MVSNKGWDASSVRCSMMDILFLCLAANRRFKPNREIRCLEQLYSRLPSHGVMFWPISPVTLTEFFLVTGAAEAPSSISTDAVDVT